MMLAPEFSFLFNPEEEEGSKVLPEYTTFQKRVFFDSVVMFMLSVS
jgi:hypothetical protein